MDEKHTPYNHKGTKIDGVEPKHRGTPATKRGLSNQQVCIITAIQRFVYTIARTLNLGKQSSIDLLRFGECLESTSFVMLDGSNSYNELLESKNCTKKVLISHESYDKFNHLNTVNSFHKLIEERLQKYKGVASKYINRYNALFVMQRETQGMDNAEKLQYVLLRLKNIYKITRLKDLKKRMVVRISDKKKNYSKITKLLVKPKNIWYFFNCSD